MGSANAFHLLNVTSPDQPKFIKNLIPSTIQEFGTSCYIPNILNTSQVATKFNINLDQLELNSTYNAILTNKYAILSTGNGYALSLYLFTSHRINDIINEKYKPIVIRSSNASAFFTSFIYSGNHGIIAVKDNVPYQLQFKNITKNLQFTAIDTFSLCDKSFGYGTIGYASNYDILIEMTVNIGECVYTLYNLGKKQRQYIDRHALNGQYGEESMRRWCLFIYDTKVYSVSNIGHVIIYDFINKEFSYFYEPNSEKNKAKRFQSKPAVWIYENEPNVLYCIGAQGYGFKGNTGNIEIRKFDMTGSNKQWRKCYGNLGSENGELYISEFFM